MSLSIILDKIKSLQPILNENLEEGPVETLRARLGRKTQATESVKLLRDEYSNYLLKTAAFIVVTGEKSNEFSTIATENYKCFNTDPDTFYSDLVDRIPASAYLGKESLPNLFDILGRHLEDKMLELHKVTGYPQLVFKNEYSRSINSREDFLSVVKRALTEQVGAEIVGIQAVDSLTDQAIERGHTAKFTPILLTTNDQKFALTIAKDLERISSKIFTVYAGESPSSKTEGVIYVDPTKESVKKTLKTISNKLKNNN